LGYHTLVIEREKQSERERINLWYEEKGNHSLKSDLAFLTLSGPFSEEEGLSGGNELTIKGMKRRTIT